MHGASKSKPFLFLGFTRGFPPKPQSGTLVSKSSFARKCTALHHLVRMLPVKLSCQIKSLWLPRRLSSFPEPSQADQICRVLRDFQRSCDLFFAHIKTQEIASETVSTILLVARTKYQTKATKKERVSVSSQFEGVVLRDGEGLVPGAGGGSSPRVCHQEAERRECWCSAHLSFDFFFHPPPPSPFLFVFS